MANDLRTIANADITINNDSSITSNGIITTNNSLNTCARFVNSCGTQTSNYTILNNDYLIPVNTSSNSVDILLPNTTTGRIIHIVDVGGNAITNHITVIGTINGSNDFIINISYMSITLWYSGSGWFII
jgi:hypothetical protein